MQAIVRYSTAHTETAPPLLASVAESARLLSVSEKYIRALMAEGKLATIRLGRRTMVRRDEVEALAVSGCDGTKVS
jgi:excisionase family DNA binding protein